MTKDKTPETAEETKNIYTYFKNEVGTYSIVFDLYGDNEMICAEEKKEPLAKVMARRLNIVLSMKTSFLQKENERLTKIIENKELREERHTGHIKVLKEDNEDMQRAYSGVLRAKQQLLDEMAAGITTSINVHHNILNLKDSLADILTKYENQKEGK